MIDDAELLRRYAETGAEEAFAELVRRHLNLVYRAAFRQCGGDTHRAHDVVQLVFTLLARRAARLTRHSSLPGWLFTTTHYTVRDVQRTERRRARREQELLLMHEDSSNGEAAEWDLLRPVLDDVMQQLGDRDRDAIIRRFFEGHSFAQIGAAVRLTEDAARMRVERALEKLRTLLERRGVRSTRAALGLMLTHEAMALAPAGTAASVAGTALALAVPVGAFAPVLTIIQSMSSSKVAATGAVLALALTTGTALNQIESSRHSLSALTAAGHERDALATKLKVLQQRATAADQAAGSLRQAVLAAQAPTTLVPTRDERLARGRDFMARHPEVHRAFIETCRAEIAGQHMPLFKLLGLSPTQIELFKDHAVQGTRQSMKGSDGLPMLYEIEGDKQAAQVRLRMLLGEDGFRQYLNPSALSSAWRIATELAGSLYSTGAPLSMEQGKQMVQILTAGSAAGEESDPNRRDWGTLMPQAEQLLSTPQLAVLRRFQELDELGRATEEIRLQQRTSPPPNGGSSATRK